MRAYSAVPQQLKDRANWVCWKFVTKKNGELTKVPFDAKTGQWAKADDPSTWTTFEAAVKAADILSGNENNYDGVGWELGGTSICGIDFDNAIDKKGVIDPYVLDILRVLGDPYTEVSPSGTGLHAFVECDALPKGGRKLSQGHNGIEIYHGREGGRYFTISANRVLGDGVPRIDDISLPYLLITQNRDQKFKALWLGDTSAYDGDDSSADFALMTRLARLTQNDPVKMEMFFSASHLGQREKWIDRADYRKRTIDKAIGGKHASSTEPQPTEQITLTLRTADTIKPKQIRWLWQGRLPFGKIALFAGNPDNGKSLASTSVAAICSRGEAFPESNGVTYGPSDVLMLIGEDDPDDTAVPRLLAAGADMKRIHFPEATRLDNAENREIRLDWDIPALEATLTANPNIRLIIIDPISNYLGDVNMMQEQDVRSVLMPLKRMAAKFSVAVIIVMHLNKKSDLDAINRVGGAMAFIGVARCSWLFARNVQDNSPEGAGTAVRSQNPDTFSMLRIKNNLVSSSRAGLSYHVETRPVEIEGEQVLTPYVVWGKGIEGSADDALVSVRRQLHTQPATTRSVGRPQDALPIAVRWLETALQDGQPHPSKELIAEAKDAEGITGQTLRRAYAALKGKASFKLDSRYCWQLVPMHETGDTESESTPQQSDLVSVEGVF